MATCSHVGWPCTACGYGSNDPHAWLRGKRERDERNALEEQIRRLERERDEYAGEVHSLTTRINGMTAAASSAAATTVIAIEHLQQHDAVVKAAQAWRTTKYPPHAVVMVCDAPLVKAIDEHTALERKRS